MSATTGGGANTTHNGAEARLLLSRNRVYILPSRHGLGFAVLNTVLLFGAINYGNSMAYMLTFLLMGMVIIAMVQTHGNLNGIVLMGTKVGEAFAGDPLLVDVILDNRGGAHRHALEITVIGGAKGADLGSVPRLFDLPAGAITTVKLSVPTVKRGQLHFERIRIASRFPLGLLRAWGYLELRLAALVYPRAKGHALPPMLVGADYGRPMERIAGDEDFTGLRSYRLGDAPRSIAWKAYARGMSLMVKEYAGGPAGRLWLTWEAASHMGDMESRLAQLCHWVVSAAAHDQHYGLRLPGRTISMGAGAAHRRRCLRALARF